MDNIYNVNGEVIEVTDYHDNAYYENLAKTALTGKVLISFGDSYTNAMSSKFAAIATKYGMAHDGRGIVSSTVTNRGVSPMCSRVDTIVSDYTSGKTIDGTTYYKNDVGIITFMGGANDPGGIAAYGTGWHETALNTLYGAANKIFNALLENFPNAKIICVTQPSSYNAVIANWITDDASAQRFGFDTAAQALVFDDIQFSNYLMANKEQIIKNTAWMYELSILDMFREFPTIFNPSNRSTYWQNDKLHLTTAGYNLVANAIDRKIVAVVAKGEQ